MAESDAQDTRRKVFISYSHKDDAWKDKLLPQLNALVQAGVGIEVWHDRRIDAGQTWYPAIEEAMADADVAVLLISADYLASDFCIKEEVPYLLKRQEQEGMLLIPVLIRKCLWKAHRWLADRQMLPGDGKCVALDFPGDLADGVFTDVAERVFDHFAALAAQPQTGATLPKAIHEVVAARVRATANAVD
ncbi:MAG: toll/interleukin-1 receptor domain-containing protein, partial [Planctomycetes bacterium]|nr:toll/interleukin-1 receptor domain-containing protein [Planctomycetota bacterium]